MGKKNKGGNKPTVNNTAAVTTPASNGISTEDKDLLDLAKINIPAKTINIHVIIKNILVLSFMFHPSKNIITHFYS